MVIKSFLNIQRTYVEIDKQYEKTKIKCLKVSTKDQNTISKNVKYLIFSMKFIYFHHCDHHSIHCLKYIRWFSTINFH